MKYALPLLLLAGCVGPDHSVQDLLTPDQFHVYYTDGDSSSNGSLGSSRDPWRFASKSDGDFDAWTVGLSWNLTGPGPGAREMREAARAMQVSARLMADAANASLNAPEPVVIVEAPTAAPEPREEPVRIVVEAAAPVAVAPVVIEVGRADPGSGEPVELRLPVALEAALLAWVSRPAPEPQAQPAPSRDPVVVVQPGAAPDITITVENAQAATVEDNDELVAPAPGADPASDPDEPQGVELLGISSEVWTQLIIAMTVLATALGTYLGREKIPGVKELTKKGKAERAEKNAAKAQEEGG